MKKGQKIQLSAAQQLSDEEQKKIIAEDNGHIVDFPEVFTTGSGTNSPRIKACEGKKYGASCSWKADDGSVQSGKCIYDKWGLTAGPLFCAKADYFNNDSTEKEK